MRSEVLLTLIVMCIATAAVQADGYVPWDELTEASWIDFGDAAAWPRMYPVNAGRPGVAASYPVAFSPTGAGGKAKGMNAIKFRHGGQTSGHMVSSDRPAASRLSTQAKTIPSQLSWFW